MASFVEPAGVGERGTYTSGILGNLGSPGYLGHLAYEVSKDAFFFPNALTMIGLAIIALAVAYQRNQRRIEAAIPAGLLAYLPRHRA